MNRFITPLIFLFFSICPFMIMANDGVSSGDASSNALQNEIDKGEISSGKASKTIDNNDFDGADGGLYCPNNQCESDPDDAANGF